MSTAFNPLRVVFTLSLMASMLALAACGGPMVRSTSTEVTTTSQMPVAPAPTTTTTTTEQSYRR